MHGISSGGALAFLAVALFMTSAVGSPAEAVAEATATPMCAELRSFAPTMVHRSSW